MFTDVKKVVETARNNFDKLLFEVREIKILLKQIEAHLRHVKQSRDSRGLPPL